MKTMWAPVPIFDYQYCTGCPWLEHPECGYFGKELEAVEFTNNRIRTYQYKRLSNCPLKEEPPCQPMISSVPSVGNE